MKRIILALAILATGVTAHAQSLPAPAQQFIDDFSGKVVSHDYAGAVKFMDKEFLKIQWDKKADPQAHQLMDEFFSGYDNLETKSNFINLKMTDITKILVYKFVSDPDGYILTFRLTLEDGREVYSQTLFKVKGKKMGFFGAVG